MAKKKKVRKRKGLRRSDTEKRTLIEEIRNLIGKGYSDYKMMEELNLQPHILNEYKQRILNDDRVMFQQLDGSSVYSDYIMKMQRLIVELDNMMVRFRNRGQFTALVAAVKQKKEIHDSVIKLGQDFGFVEKKAKKLEVTGEMTFSTMTEAQVKKEIQAELKRLNDLTKGGSIAMREEVLGVTSADVKKYLPVSAELPEDLIDVDKIKKKAKRKKAKVKTKLTLQKNV